MPAEVVMALRSIDTGRGSEALYRHQLPGLLTELANRARVQSITASSAIEGVVVPDAQRAERIIDDKAGPLRNRSEQELAGYRKALDYLFQEDWHPLNLGLVLHLHRLLWSETAYPGGQLKTDDNLVVDRSPDGTTTVRFTPVPAARTESCLRDLLDRYRAAQQDGRHHPVLLVGLMVLDLLVIHPFADGNGRVGRVLTNALLVEAGYEVCRWVSLEQLVAETADEYYEALLRSTHNWHEDSADPWPWLSYFVTTLAAAYRRFADRAAADRSSGTKQDRVRDYVLNHAELVFKLSQVRQALPGVSDPTIRLVLEQLKSEGRVKSSGTGRGAVWVRLPDQI
ncbi:Fic family protein [Kribbella sp. NPDC026611]|uniref:Fic family protein n=1 Tax=Kribbella sp. NPDC026611 TaxID=3154911 RepID=UPI0033FFB1A8